VHPKAPRRYYDGSTRELALKPALKDAEPQAPAFNDSLANIQAPPSANFAVYLCRRPMARRSSGDSNQVFVPLVFSFYTQERSADVIPEGVKIAGPGIASRKDSGLTVQYGYRHAPTGRLNQPWWWLSQALE